MTGLLVVMGVCLLAGLYVVLSARQINRRRDRARRVTARGWKGWDWEADLPEFEDWRRAA